MRLDEELADYQTKAAEKDRELAEARRRNDALLAEQERLLASLVRDYSLHERELGADVPALRAETERQTALRIEAETRLHAAIDALPPLHLTIGSAQLAPPRRKEPAWCPVVLDGGLA